MITNALKYWNFLVDALACIPTVTFLHRALLEAQKVFGLDFDMEEFAQFGEDKTDYLDDEEQEEEVNCIISYKQHIDLMEGGMVMFSPEL